MAATAARRLKKIATAAKKPAKKAARKPRSTAPKLLDVMTAWFNDIANRLDQTFRTASCCRYAPVRAEDLEPGDWVLWEDARLWQVVAVHYDSQEHDPGMRGAECIIPEHARAPRAPSLQIVLNPPAGGAAVTSGVVMGSLSDLGAPSVPSQVAIRCRHNTFFFVPVTIRR